MTVTPERGDRAKVVVNMGVVATLSELVLAIWNSIGQHQGIGAFFANGPCKGRKGVLLTNRARNADLSAPSSSMDRLCSGHLDCGEWPIRLAYEGAVVHRNAPDGTSHLMESTV